jgi:prevent-host-death family protein
MKSIGIRELKARLSGVLREVQAGETVLVTDRGRVIAQLSSVQAGATSYPSVERGLARLASTGALRGAERPQSHCGRGTHRARTAQ